MFTYTSFYIYIYTIYLTGRAPVKIVAASASMSAVGNHTSAIQLVKADFLLIAPKSILSNSTFSLANKRGEERGGVRNRCKIV